MIPIISSCDTKDVVPNAVRDADTVIIDTYEAENGRLINTVVASDVEDYSHTGYVGPINAMSGVSFAIDSPVEGEYGITLRYINGSDSLKYLVLSVNGVDYRAECDVCPNEYTWCECTVPVSLLSGDNVVSVLCDSEDNAGILLDRIGLSRVYQAENAVIRGNGMVASAYNGYTGGGYVPFNKHGIECSFDVDAPVTGAYEMTIRYSAAQTDSTGRRFTLTVNGGDGEQVVLAPTKSHTTWLEYRHTIALNKGENSLSISYGDNDNGQFNLDCFLLKPSNWIYAGRVLSLEGNNTPNLLFKLDNCDIRIDSVADNTVRVWVDKDRAFTRKYKSAAVANEAVNPKKLSANETEKYYVFATDAFIVRVYKDPLRIAYLDKSGQLLTVNEAYSLGWSSDDEMICRNVIGEDEHFWGLGETPISFDRLGTKCAMWGNDHVAAQIDSAVPAKVSDGRWYMNNPVFSSSKGYTILFDNPGRTVFDFGSDEKTTYYFGSLNPYPAGELIYYFFYGNSVKKSLTAMSDVIGKSFFAPMWGYGNLQSHWGYSQADIERVATEYRNKGIPLDLIISDIDWYKSYCTPTAFNEKNYPDPDAMLALLNNINVRYGVIDDPNVTDGCADYIDGDNGGYFVTDRYGKTLKVSWAWGGNSGLTDFFNPTARLWWMDLHSQLTRRGISFYWMDMNEPSAYNTNWFFHNTDGKAMGTIADCKNLYAQMQQRTLYEMMTQNGSRTLLLSRSGYTGTQRYTCPWTGDIQSDWDAMTQQLNLGLGLSMSGYMYWTFDIGGSAGSLSDEQFKRWIELGTFMPITRYHSTAIYEQREPYTHGAEDIAKKYISLRYTLIPYFYSMSADSIIGIGIESEKGSGSGLPLVRPMLMEYSDDEKTWGMTSQFLSGNSLLVAPVTDVLSYKMVYFPKGDWYDFSNPHVIYAGGQIVKYPAAIDVLPVFVKAGSIIPMRDSSNYTGETPLSTLYFNVYPTINSGECSFVYYEDDGETTDYLSGKFSTMAISCKTDHSLIGSKTSHNVIIGARDGEYTDIAPRDIIIRLALGDRCIENVKLDGKKLSIYSNEKELADGPEGAYFDIDNGSVHIKLRDTATKRIVTVATD